MTQQLQTLIDNAWDNRASLSPSAAPKEIQDAVEHVIAELNNGTLRVATRSVPLFSSAITCSTASWISLGAAEGERLARLSQALSMRVCSCWVMLLSVSLWIRNQESEIRQCGTG